MAPQVGGCLGPMGGGDANLPQCDGRVASARVDRGANGMYSGDDVKWIHGQTPKHFADVIGLNNHQANDVEIGTVTGVLTMTKGPVVAIFHQAAHSGKGKTILSSLQMENFGAIVDN